ncbi:fatty acyl-CoA reductase wat-like [Helicoverpa zea]|uniref:fatty acyl-CoA reductase wat-like n=1 Tax=Helicoverpa zea TaxID=7113 RepID=UPI001F59FC6B|nr:fatty acyl-CoA reductase wat-like [Helicoverpa zea]
METEAMDPAQEFVAKVHARQKPVLEAIARWDSPVQQFYENTTVFITGGSGFLGKQLIEKLFRATKISKILLLLRSKKGKPIEQRLLDMLQDPVFDAVKELHPNFAEKIIPVAGDVAEMKLGLSEKDWNMVADETDIFMHVAATTRFDEPLKIATLINVRGAREALLLGKACKKLKSYVHVSTAYSYACENMINTEVLEDFYKSPIDPETLIQLAETVDEEKLNDISSGLIKNWPNTYSFGKAVAEETVRSMADGLPLCIVRPAIVIVAHKEPTPGWLDMSNVYGASGVVLGPGIGLMHTIMSDNDVNIGLVPVDYVNNAIIVSAYETYKKIQRGETKPKIYTVTTSTRNPTRWGWLVDFTEGYIAKHYPSPSAIAYAFAWGTNNPTVFWLYSWLLHFIPAYVIDAVCFVLGKERRFVKIYTKMFKMSIALSYFTVNDWRFIDDNTAALYDGLSTIDKTIFNFDVTQLQWTEYMVLWCLGLRKFIVKDGLKGSAYAVKKQFFFKILFCVLFPAYLFLLYKVFVFAISSLYLVLRLFF